jgi:hypothetical protein
MERAPHRTARDKRRQFKMEGALWVAVAVGRGQFDNPGWGTSADKLPHSLEKGHEKAARNTTKNCHIPLKRARQIPAFPWNGNGTATHNSTTNSHIPLKRAWYSNTQQREDTAFYKTIILNSLFCTHKLFFFPPFNTVFYSRNMQGFYQHVTNIC